MVNQGDIISAFDALAKETEYLIKQDLKQKGLYKTGALDRSIKVFAVKVGDVYVLDMQRLDYFKYLDEKNNILIDVFKTNDFKNILKEVAVLNAQLQLQQMLEDLNKE